MTSSAIKQPNLFLHWLRLAAIEAVPRDLNVNAMFRVFNRNLDPTDDASKFDFLALARVNMIIRDETGTNPDVVTPCRTDNNGQLRTTSGYDVIITDVKNYDGRKVFFEVIGPVMPLGNTNTLTSMKYEPGTPAKYFPIQTWSTEGWMEPEGYPGSFTLPTGLPNLGDKRSFTVGCYLNTELRFTRGDDSIALYPENVVLKSVADTHAGRPMDLRPHGILREHVFDAVYDKPIEFQGFFNATPIGPDNILPTTGNVTITPAGSTTGVPVLSVPGKMVGLPTIPNAKNIELRTQQDTITFPTLMNDTTCRLRFDAYKQNLMGTYQNLTTDEKKVVYYNWFLEFTAYRNLFMRVMNQLCLGSNLPWQGLTALSLNVDDLAGGAFATGQAITAHLEFILQPRDDVCIHEMGHTMANDPRYFGNMAPDIYFAAVTNNHHMSSYSHELFAFREGFPQFLASLFMSPEATYLLDPPYVWPNLFKFTQTAPNFFYDIEFGFDQTALIPINQMEDAIGLAVEGCFSAALTAIVRHIWTKRSTSFGANDPAKQWVVDVDGSGALSTGPGPANPNYWLMDPDFKSRFITLILNPLMRAANAGPTGKLLGGVSTRRVIDQIQIAASASSVAADSNWQVIEPLIAPFKALNEFYVSAITPQGGSATQVVRWVAASREYHFPPSVAPVTLTAGASTTLAIQGIRIPTTFTVKLMLGTAVVTTVTATAASEYAASVTFDLTGVTIPPNVGATPFDLLFETGGTPNRTLLFKEVTVV